jgi:hypothetical protein
MHRSLDKQQLNTVNRHTFGLNSALTRIYHHNVVLVIAMEVIYEITHAIQREVLAQGEDFVFVHIVDIWLRDQRT